MNADDFTMERISVKSRCTASFLHASLNIDDQEMHRSVEYV